MEDESFELPELILIEDYNGNYSEYIEIVYEAFKEDFVFDSPSFRGEKLRLKKHPVFDGKEYTFYHMTHKGKDEQNREPDLRRCERIKWGKPTVNNCESWKLKIWEQNRKGELRVCIWLEVDNDFDYIFILNRRKNYWLPWTAFVLEYEHQKRKKQKEYNAYVKSKSR